MAVNIDIEPRRHGLHLPPKIILPAAGVLAALAVGVYALSRGESSSQTSLITQAQGQDSPPPAGSGGDGEPPPKPPEIPVVAPPLPKPEAEKKSVPLPSEKELVCGIFEPKYCNLIEIINWENATGQKFRIGAVKLPKGVSKIPIKAPIKGQIAKTKLNEPAQIHGFSAILFDPDNPKRNFNFQGDLQFTDMLTVNTPQGAEFAHIVNTGIPNRGGYQLFFYVLNNSQVEEETLRGLVPEEVFNNPSKPLTFEGTSGSATNYYDVYQKK